MVCAKLRVKSMGFVGYVAVCVQLYCRGKLSLFHTTCFGLYGHLQVCRMLLLNYSITSYTPEDGHMGRNM
jgi:hypothetical protein